MKALQLVFFAGIFFCLNAQCPQDDSLWNTLSSQAKLSQITDRLNNLDEACFISAVSEFYDTENVKFGEAFAETVQKWIKLHNVSTELLVAFYNNPLIYKNRDLWSDVLLSWKRKYLSINEAHAFLTAKGQFNVINTLYEILDKEDFLSVYDRLKWVKIKSLIGETGTIAKQYCRIIGSEPRMTPVALDQFSFILREFEKQTADSVLGDFFGCCVYRSGTDRVQIREWGSETCLRLGLYKRQIEILKALETREFPVDEELMGAAFSHLNSQRYELALKLAKELYFNRKSSETNQSAAFIIYESFRGLERNDSALQWLKRVDLNSLRQLTDAVVLCQNVGAYEKALAFIAKMPRGYTFDTMTVRQFLFTGKRSEAYDMVKNGQCREEPVWAVRTAIFDKKFMEASVLLDSISLQNVTNKGEFLLYRYWFQRLAASPDLLELWSQIEYNIYINKFSNAVKLLSEIKKTDQSWELALLVAKQLINNGDSQTALTLLKQHESTDVSAEFLYSRADAMLRIGEIDDGCGVLEKIMLEYPDDIYAGRARLLLLSRKN